MVRVRTKFKFKLYARRTAATYRNPYVTNLERKPLKVGKRGRRPMTYAERQLLNEKRAKRREEYEDALQEAMDGINESAAILREKFGGAHDLDYYKQQILQVSRKKDSSRKTNPWNAFLRSELAKMNQGASYYSIFPITER